MSWRFGLALVAACGSSAPPPSRPPVEPPPRPVPVIVAPVVPARTDLAVPTAPTSLVASRGALYWSDAMGAVYTMPANGSAGARQLSDGKKFAFHLFRSGERVFATSRKDLLEVTADGVRSLDLKLADLPEESVGDAAALYITIFKRNEIVRIGVDDHARATLASVPRGVLGVFGDTLYIASYSAGTLTAVPTRGGAARTIAKNLPRPTAVAADAEAAYVYCERDRSVRRIDLASGAAAVIATDLENSDDLVSDGGDLWTITWGTQPGLVRIHKDGTAPAARMTNDLRRPTKLAVDEEYVYVSSHDEPRIIRLARTGFASSRQR